MSKYIGLFNFHHSRLTRPDFNMRPPITPESIMEIRQSMVDRIGRGLPVNFDALIVSPGVGETFDPKSKTQVLYVLSGNRRHAACEALGTDAPLQCQVYEYDSFGEMLADMGVPNVQREDPPPLSLARYYAHCLDHMPMRQLVRQIGKSANTIEGYLMLPVKLCPAAQELLANGDITLSAARELFPLHPHPDLQARVAAGLAKRGASGSVASAAVKLVLSRLDEGVRTIKPKSTRQLPVVLSNDVERIEGTGAPAIEGLPIDAIASVQDLRLSAQQSCATCPQVAATHVAEPAWHLAVNAAGFVCTHCSMKSVHVCQQCPLAEALKRVVASAFKPAPKHEVRCG